MPVGFNNPFFDSGLSTDRDYQHHREQLVSSRVVIPNDALLIPDDALTRVRDLSAIASTDEDDAVDRATILSAISVVSDYIGRDVIAVTRRDTYYRLAQSFMLVGAPVSALISVKHGQSLATG